MKRHSLLTTAVLVASAVLTSCSIEQQVENKTSAIESNEMVTYQVSISATKADAVTTRSLTPTTGDAAINSKWNGEPVYAYYGETPVGTLTSTASGTTTTTLTGEISKTGGFSANDELTLYYLKDKGDHGTYSGQLGTVPDISSNFDYATATVKVLTVFGTADANVLTTESATFTRSQSITKFSFTQGGSPANVSSLTITATGLTGNPLTITPTTASSDIFAALHNSGTATYTFAATIGGTIYEATKSANLVDGNYYITTIALGTAASGLTFSEPSSATYTGSAITLTIKDGETTLTEGTDYEITYEKGGSTVAQILDAGTYTVTITGKGNYGGTKTTTVTIDKGTPEIFATGLVDGSTILTIGETATTIGASATLGATIDDITVGADADTGTATLSSDKTTISGATAGTVTVTITTAATDNLNAATKTFNIAVRQSGIGGTLANPGTGVEL